MANRGGHNPQHNPPPAPAEPPSAPAEPDAVIEVDVAGQAEAVEMVAEIVEAAEQSAAHEAVTKCASKADIEAGFVVLALGQWQQNLGAAFQSVARLPSGKIEVFGATVAESSQKLYDALVKLGYSGEAAKGYDGAKYNEWLRARG